MRIVDANIVLQKQLTIFLRSVLNVFTMGENSPRDLQYYAYDISLSNVSERAKKRRLPRPIDAGCKIADTSARQPGSTVAEIRGL